MSPAIKTPFFSCFGPVSSAWPAVHMPVIMMIFDCQHVAHTVLLEFYSDYMPESVLHTVPARQDQESVWPTYLGSWPILAQRQFLAL